MSNEEEPMDIDIDPTTHDTSAITKQPSWTRTETFTQAAVFGHGDKLPQVISETGQLGANPSDSPLQQTPSDSPLQQTISDSPPQQTPSDSPLQQTPSDLGAQISNNCTTSQDNPQQNHPERRSAPVDGLNDAAKTSVSKDTAKVTIKVEFAKEIPQKWKTNVHKALQSWFNDNMPKEKAEVVSLETMPDPLCAEVVITPSRALDTLKKIKTLTFKETKETATVHFMVGELKSVDGQETQTMGQVSPQDDAGMTRDLHMAADPGSPEPSVLTVPLYQHWYLMHAYKKELNQIKKEFGVKIDAEVSVSITAESEKTRNDSVHKAVQRFTDLVQHITTLGTITIPQAQMESDIVKEALHNIPNEEAKMMLNRSADTCLLFGPNQLTSKVQKELSTSDTSVLSTRASQENSGTLEVDIKDTQVPLVMDGTHWKLVKTAFQTQLSDIERKYGVVFFEEVQNGSVKVRSQSKGMVNLQTQAQQALIHLYQKVAMSAMTCTLREQAYTKIIGQALRGLHSKVCYVDSRDKYDHWKLVGLPKHLLPVIVNIEVEIGKSVFDDTTKQSLGYSEYSPQGWRHTGLGAGRAPGRADLGDGGEAATSSTQQRKAAEDSARGTDTGEEDNCPICMDVFTSKKRLNCGHEYCSECLDQAVKSMGQICPVCKQIFGKVTGNQPLGTMTTTESTMRLPGFTECGTITIQYNIPNGIQTEKHQNPGKAYRGTQRVAYLPANKEGRGVLRLLERAFDQGLIFTVGTSTTTGETDCVTWNDIHHKTSTNGGPSCFGYPDADYLKRVRAELKAKGIE
ncbi:E3 ubiquitin-protein ligase DTX3L [Brachyhypopomus gauderio]|uniref:E3 ubiquitin-protein ligase DTX3L n=1 Tax=Brachyhypopomus gauderio TaxID=698409 RepID=UPI0040438C2F